MLKNQTTWDNFASLDIRVGKVIKVEDFARASKPTYKLEIDFGRELGIKKSSAQLVDFYSKEDLLGKLVVGVVNFPPKNIAGFMSEVLVLGIYQCGTEKVVLLRPDSEDVELGDVVG
jgi:tRNA-binding protein